MASASQSTSYISAELAVTLAVVAAGIGYGFYTRTQAHNATASANSGPASSSAAGGSGTTGKGKGKKKAKGSASLSSSVTAKAGAGDPASPLVVPFPDVIVGGGGSGVIPGGFESKDGDDEESAAGASASGLSKSKKSKKNKKKAPTATEVSVAGKLHEASPSPTGASTPRPAAAVDSDADSASALQPQPSKKSKKKKSKATGASSTGDLKAGGAEAALSSSAQQRSHQHPLEYSTASIDTDGSWTRVESRQRTGNNSKNDLTSSSKNDDSGAGLTPTTGNSSPVLERGSVTSSAEDDGEEGPLGNLNHRDSSDKKKTLAEKMIPKPRKTGVEDLLETPDYPTLSRVMRIKPGPDDKPATGFSWADYEDVDATRVIHEDNDADGSEDDGWGVVKSKRSRQAERSSNFGTASASTQPQQSSSTQAEALTKQQRKNAKRKEAEKAAKAAAKEDQEAALRKHKRELEKAKIAEQASSSKKATSGGMKAVVDGNGKLVWE